MTVTAEYAQSHLQELLSASEQGEQVKITREDGFVVTLTSAPKDAESVGKAPLKDRSGLFGAFQGKMWLADDWDSSETNDEIAKIFNESELCPSES